MNDLISRKALNEAISYALYSSIRLDVSDIRNIINNQPIAYDVDKVVEALEIKSIPCNEKGKCIWTEENQLGCEECVKRKAVKIVKGSGADE